LAGAPTTLGELTELPRPLAGFRGLLRPKGRGEGRRGEGSEGEREGEGRGWGKEGRRDEGKGGEGTALPCPDICLHAAPIRKKL